MSKNSTRVQSNLLQQNCYVRDCSLKKDLQTPDSEFTYLSIDEKPTHNGLVHEVSEYPYEITPSYVNSFADSSDYRKDPLNAIANGIQRSNLGDVSDLQKVLSMDESQQLALLSQLKAKFAQASAQAPAQPQAPVPEGGSV